METWSRDKQPMAQKVDEACLEDWRTRSELKEHLLSAAERPIVFRRCLDSWTFARSWSPVAVSRLLGSAGETSFKVCPRRGSEEYRRRFGERETVFETQCWYVQATFTDFAEWLESGESSETSDAQSSDDPEPRTKSRKSSSHNPLQAYSPSRYWIYADYKYMSQICDGRPELMRAIDWSVLGFDGRGGADSTLWAGSEGASTPCHYDTYGCNLVAQLWGKKKWTLYSPNDSAHLYPTRIPYEESSVFSEVNIPCPDLERYPNFPRATSYTVRSGDTLI